MELTKPPFEAGSDDALTQQLGSRESSGNSEGRLEFGKLSVSLSVKDCPISLKQMLRLLLLGVVKRLGEEALGHAKAIARLPQGSIYASTTGVPPVVNFKETGSLEIGEAEFQVDAVYIFTAVSQQKLAKAFKHILNQLKELQVDLERRDHIETHHHQDR